MKKIAYLLIVTFFLGVLFSSCRTSRPCPAYGEEKYYQIEKPFRN